MGNFPESVPRHVKMYVIANPRSFRPSKTHASGSPRSGSLKLVRCVKLSPGIETGIAHGVRTMQYISQFPEIIKCRVLCKRLAETCPVGV